MSTLPQVIVSPEDLNGLLEESRKPIDLSKYLSNDAPRPTGDQANRRGQTPVNPPASELENMIATTWNRVLGIAAIGVDENFFDLGGHSLLLVRVHTELQKSLKRPISITSLFQYPTIATLAEHLGASASETPSVNPAQERAGRFKQALAKQRTAARP